LKRLRMAARMLARLIDEEEVRRRWTRDGDSLL